MRIGLLSDTHDDLVNVRAAAALFAREGIATLLHGGDVCGPGVVEALQAFDVTFALGNADRMPALGLAVEALHGRGRLASFHRLVLDGYSVALLHGHDQGMLDYVVRSGDFAFVIHGHLHRQVDRAVGLTRVISPGALGGSRNGPFSCCILDLETGQTRFFELAVEVS